MKKIRWKKDWPWIALGVIAVGWFFLHRPAPPAPSKQPRQTRGRGRHANQTAGTDTGGYA